MLGKIIDFELKLGLEDLPGPGDQFGMAKLDGMGPGRLRMGSGRLSNIRPDLVGIRPDLGPAGLPLICISFVFFIHILVIK